MQAVTVGQNALVIASAALFAAAAGISLARIRWESNLPRLLSKALAYIGIVVGFAVLLWHSGNRGNWMPLGDNFDTLVSLGLLLAMFVLYTQAHRPLRGLDWFLLPVVILLLLAAVLFGQTQPHQYVNSTWSWTHRISAYGGAVAFAVAGAAGSMYLMVHRRLRTRGRPPGPPVGLGSLERLEHLTLGAVALGFGLLTIGAVTGLAHILSTEGGTRLGDQWYLNPKVLLALIVWVIYAIVLHSPINPSFRGRRVAMLSVVGFLLMIGTVIAVQLVPPSQ